MLRWGPVAVRLDLRSIAVCTILAITAAALFLTALMVGDFPIGIGEALVALTGTTDGMAHTVVVEWRLPRALAAVAFGAALGVSGAIFQSVTRNALAGPDIIGFSAGAHTGALIVIIVGGGTYLQVATGALIGGLATAAVVYLLAYRAGVAGLRLIVTSLGISAMLTSVNALLMMRADLEVAMAAAVWGAGSLTGITTSQAFAATAAVTVLMGAAVALASPMRLLELGDDTARSLGVRVERSRLALIVVGVALTATVTAAAGPIAFVALAAPQIARRLTATAGVTVIPAACLGSVLLICADLVAQHALPTPLPVGVITTVLGGTYLVWLLVREEHRTR